MYWIRRVELCDERDKLNIMMVRLKPDTTAAGSAEAGRYACSG
jgi:hypothetical protein